MNKELKQSSKYNSIEIQNVDSNRKVSIRITSQIEKEGSITLEKPSEFTLGLVIKSESKDQLSGVLSSNIDK